MIPAIILVKQSLHYKPDGPARTLSWNVLIAHCMQRGAVLSETVATVSLSTGINRCGGVDCNRLRSRLLRFTIGGNGDFVFFFAKKISRG